MKDKPSILFRLNFALYHDLAKTSLGCRARHVRPCSVTGDSLESCTGFVACRRFGMTSHERVCPATGAQPGEASWRPSKNRPWGLRQLRALEVQGLRVPLIVRLLLLGAEVERRASSSSSGLAIFSVSCRWFLVSCWCCRRYCC